MNPASYIVLTVLIDIIALIITGMINDKKKGRTSCSHGCENCALHGKCQELRKMRELREKQISGS